METPLKNSDGKGKNTIFFLKEIHIEIVVFPLPCEFSGGKVEPGKKHGDLVRELDSFIHFHGNYGGSSKTLRKTHVFFFAENLTNGIRLVLLRVIQWDLIGLEKSFPT